MATELRFGYDGDGGLGDRLVQAVLRGDKTATSSLAVEYLSGERLPRVGERLRLVDGRGRRHATVETTAVTIAPLDRVGDDVAHAEGEGFATAAEWRAGHTAYWRELADLIRAESGDPAWTLRDGEPVVLHHFRLVETAARSEASIQERLYPDLPCFGCGPANANGLRLQSYPAPDGGALANFAPWPEHDNGLGYLNGGIISTVLDCHSAAVVMDEADRRGWHPLGGAALSYVTAGLQVRYLRPAPLHEPVDLRGQVIAADSAEMTAEVQLWWDGKPRAEATALWKRWRPRE